MARTRSQAGSRGRSSSSSTGNRSRSRQGGQSGQGGTMSREEAGRMGGLAPHVCRGRECSAQNQRGSQGRSSNRSRSSRSAFGFDEDLF